MRIGNRYELLTKIGQGGMGVVYQAYDRLEKETIALKQVIVPEKQLATKLRLNPDELKLRLAHEFSILASLRHPHILSVLDYGFDEQDQPFYTMPFLQASQNVLVYTRDKAEQEKYHILLQILQALHYLHRRNVIHRDLKPDNILVTPDGVVKVMDFGLAQARKYQSDEEVQLAGTLLYIAPELFQGRSPSAASDLYAYGIIAYEMLLGHYPFPVDDVSRLIGAILHTNPDIGDLDIDVALWLEQLIEKDPQRRFKTAYAALEALSQNLEIYQEAETKAIRESFLQAAEFVGRDAELHLLTQALEQVLTGANAFYLIGGESGVGKTRLVDELRISALVKRALVLRGWGIEGGGLPFQLWREIARHLLLIVPIDDLQAGILKDIVPDIEDLLGREIPDIPALTGNAYQERMVQAIVALIREVPQPIVLLLEDLQWVTESLEPLKKLLQAADSFSHLMIVANYRSDEAPNLAEKLQGMQVLQLERFDSEAIQTLSQYMLGEETIAAPFIELLQSETEGNIFFIIEVIRALAEESGGLEQVGLQTLPQSIFTGGMQQIIQRRLNKVAPEYRSLQDLAAVLGRQIDTALLAYHFPASLVEAWLINAAEYAVLDIQANQWRFAHDKFRETLLEMLEKEAVMAVHRAAAQAIESVYPDDPQRFIILAQHWHHAGDSERENHYAQLAAKQAWKQGALIEAIQYVNRSIDLTHDPQTKLEVLLLKGDILILKGAYAEALSLYTQIAELAQELDDYAALAKAFAESAWVTTQQGQLDMAKAYAEQAVKIARLLDKPSLLARAVNNYGIALWQHGQLEEALVAYQESLSINQNLGALLDIGRGYNNIGWVSFQLGLLDKAKANLEQALAIFKQLDAQWFIALSTANLAGVLVDLGDLDTAFDYLQTAIRYDLLHQSRRNAAQNRACLAYFYVLRGEFALALESIKKAQAEAQTIGAMPVELMSIAQYAFYLHWQGQAQLASDYMSFVLHHPARSSDILTYYRKYLSPYIPELETVPPVTLEQIRKALAAATVV